MNISTFRSLMSEKGWVIIDNAVDKNLIARMTEDIEEAYTICRKIQIANGIEGVTESTVHHLPAIKTSFIDFLDTLPIFELVEAYFDGKFILNSLGGAINTKNVKSYAHNIHRDVRSYYSEKPIMLNTLVMLDDFTSENGATYLMTGSHRRAEKPSIDEFFAKAEQATAPSGSILIFDSNVWHAAGESSVDTPRRSITPMFSRPFVKQQFDYPRAIGYDKAANFSPRLRQILGYNARVPASLDEWYQPPAHRMYRPDQE